MTDPVHLSPREREIARLMADGYSYSEIAAAFGWKAQSVRLAAHRISERLPGKGPPMLRILVWEFQRRSGAPNPDTHT